MPRAVSRAMAKGSVERPALQAKSTNTLKRPLENDSKGHSIPKRTKQSSSTHQKVEWDIAGQYKITSVDQELDTSGFSFKLFHHNNGLDHHVYARFIFDKLEGIMRLAPREAMKSRSLGKFRLCDFERACELEQDHEPVPRNESWVMRWRAKEGGMRLGELISDDANNAFTISMDEDSTSREYIGVKVTFDINFNNHAFKFEAIKTKNLEAEASLSPRLLIAEWEDLKPPMRLAAVPPQVLSSRVKGLESQVNEAATLIRDLGSNLKDLRNCAQPIRDDDCSEDEDLLDKHPKTFSIADQLRMNTKRSIQNGYMLEQTSIVLTDDVVRTLTSQSERSLSRAAPVLVANGRGGMSKVIEVLPSWAWDMAGEWKVELPMLASALGFDKKKSWKMHFQVSNNPLHTRVGRQLWARLSFGDLRGYMRFCPMKGDLEDGPETVKGFEEACVLPTGCWPGPSPKGQQKWLLRWRGEGTDYGTAEGSDEQQNDCIFEKAKDGTLNFTGVMFYDGQPLLLKAKQVEEAPLEKGNSVTITTCWNSLKPVNSSRSRRYIVSA
ncbi:hypothetical protein N431DRAFT_483923 [Stipitochalara longipes BDJ]|nr:hypothetical protein N431DRAFT_483923 [Stipitochalara longipes BDJ]